MNDWTRIKDCLWATEIPEDRKKEAWRWSALARDWIDANGIDARSVVRGDMLRFVEEVEPMSGAKNPHQRIWAFNLLVAAAQAVAAPERGDPVRRWRASMLSPDARRSARRSLA